MTLDAATGKAAQWPYVLAQKVNAESSIFNIGVLQSQNRVTSVVPVVSPSQNKVYRNIGYPDYAYQIDKTFPQPPTPPASDEWKEGVSYTVGQIVTYQGKRYRCLQAHTAWAGAGWTPATTPSLSLSLSLSLSQAV